MVLNYVYGNSGSGKSTYLCETVTELAKKNPEKKYIILVPEQYTLHTQRQYVLASEKDVIINIDVLSFNRLAFRILEELGQVDIKTMDDLGKSLILRRLTNEHKEQLGALKGNITRPGYIDEIKSLVTELVQYNVSPEQLEILADADSTSKLLKSKLRDVKLIYSDFLNRVHAKGVMGEELLQYVADRMDHSELLTGATVIFDGFTGFTPIQMLFLREAFKKIEEAYVSLTCDNRESITSEYNVTDLFGITKKTVKALDKLVTDSYVGGSIGQIICLKDGDKKRYKNSMELFHLEENLFRNHVNKYSGKVNDIKIIQTPSVATELDFVASEIKRLVREEKFRYRDIAVVSGDVENYSHYVPAIFKKYDIPMFLDMKQKVLYEPMSEFIHGLVDMVKEDASYDSVMRVLRTGLLAIPADIIDEFDNYILARGIDGRRRSNYREAFERFPKGTSSELITELNEVRKQIKEIYESLSGTIGQVNTIAEKNKALRDCFKLYVNKIMEGDAEVSEERKINDKIYELILDTLDTIDSVTGEDVINLEDYADLLDTALGELEQKFIPTYYDLVTVGDIERTRLEDIKVLFFMGVNDGIIPASSDNGGIFSDLDRETILELADASGVELAPTKKERAFIQRFYLYMNMTKPSNRLYITRFGVGTDGKSLRPSYLIGSIQRMFPEISVETIGQGRGFVDVNQVATYENGLALLSENIRNLIQGENAPEAKALLQWYLSNDEYREDVKNILNGVFLQHSSSNLSEDITKLLYGDEMNMSISQLQEFNQCPYKYFLKYGLALKKRENYEFSNTDFGTLLHNSLELYTKKLISEGNNWQDISSENRDKYCNEVMDLALAAEKNDALFNGAKNKYLRTRIRAALDFCIDVLSEQASRGKFTTVGSEVYFKADENSSLSGTTTGGRKYAIHGVIDRVDMASVDDRRYLAVTDYKTGNSVKFDLAKMYRGLAIQLPVYLKAALEDKNITNGLEVSPAGMFYYKTTEPMLSKISENVTDEELRSSLLQECRLDGIYSVEDGVTELFDWMGSEKKSKVIKYEVKSDGEISSHAVPYAYKEAEILRGLDYVTDKIGRDINSITTGDISISPYKDKDSTPCSYCDYKSVCGFDERVAGFEYREMDSEADKSAMLNIMKGEQ